LSPELSVGGVKGREIIIRGRGYLPDLCFPRVAR
jgi:hypothetical protein